MRWCWSFIVVVYTKRKRIYVGDTQYKKEAKNASISDLYFSRRIPLNKIKYNKKNIFNL